MFFKTLSNFLTFFKNPHFYLLLSFFLVFPDHVATLIKALVEKKGATNKVYIKSNFLLFKVSIKGKNF